VVAGALLALLAGCTGADAGAAAGTVDPGPAATATTRAAPAQPAKGLQAAREFRSPRRYRPTPEPVRLDIPAIGVSTGLQRLGQAQDGTVEVPKGWDEAGWYAPGPRPGDPGSAVMLGHVDSTSGPAVFFRLRQLRHGDRIEVTREDRSSVRFVVARIDQYDKRRFPTDDVYYPTLTPTLRLVTCGGTFDPVSGHYRANIIVFATLRR
jgi:sortase (surface protein transpeptidase)